MTRPFANTIVLDVSPTVSTSAYTANDAVGGLMTFNGAVRRPGMGGTIKNITLIDQANQKAAIDLFVFTANPTGTTVTDNAALDIADADLLNCIATINLAAASYVTVVDNAIITVSGTWSFNIPAGQALYIAARTTGTPTYAATTDVKVRVVIEQD